MYYFETRMESRLEQAMILSLLIHILVLILYHLVPRTAMMPPGPEPIKVKFIEPQKESPPDKGRLIEAPKSRKIEEPRTAKLLAKHNSRAHSNLKKKQGDEYQGAKLMVPKSRGQPLVSKKNITPRKKKTAAKPQMKTAETTPLSRSSDRGLQIGINPQIKTSVPVEESRQLPDSVFALLDGFDANPYATTDTGDLENLDDGEVISLDTKETLYADYFARIKHQIERVWGYPEAAARNGISGQLTLRFQISHEGNLLKVIITHASGARILDSAAVKAVKMAAPYYPFPDTIKKEKLAIMATFIYSPSYGRAYQAQSFR